MYGNMIGAIVQGAAGSTMVGMGHAASWKAKKQWGEYEKLANAIGDDPEQRGLLNTLGRQERLYRAGADTNTAYGNRLAMNAGAQTQANLARAAGGHGLVQNMLSSQAVTQRQLGANAAQAAARADQMLGARGELINLMAQRRYDLQRYRRDAAMAKWAQTKQFSNNMISSGMSQVAGSGATFAGSGGGGMGGDMMGGAKSAPASTPPQYANGGYKMLSYDGDHNKNPTSAYDQGQQVQGQNMTNYWG